MNSLRENVLLESYRQRREDTRNVFRAMFIASQAFIAAISLLIAYGITSKQYLLFAIIPLTMFAFAESLLICTSMLSLSSKASSKTVSSLAQLARDESLAEDDLSYFSIVMNQSLAGPSILMFIIGFYSVFAVLGVYFFSVYQGLPAAVSLAVVYIVLFIAAILSGRQLIALAFKKPRSLSS
jgi:hypothetical protein